MKKILALSMSIITACALVTSCTEKESVSVDVASVGAITVSRSMPLATGQYASFEAPLVMNPLQSSDYVAWYDQSTGAKLSSSVQGDNSSTLTQSWSEYGSYTIKCQYSYLWENENLTKEATYNVSVCQAHILNSCVGDSLESVLSDNSGLTVLPDNSAVYVKIIDSKSYYFTFANGLLSQGMTVEAKSSTAEGAAYGYLTYEYVVAFNGIINKDNMFYLVEYKSDYTPTTEVEEAVAAFKNGDNLTGTSYSTVISEAVVSGDIAYLGVLANYVDNCSDVKLNIYITAGANVGEYSVVSKTIAVE